MARGEITAVCCRVGDDAAEGHRDSRNRIRERLRLRIRRRRPLVSFHFASSARLAPYLEDITIRLAQGIDRLPEATRARHAEFLKAQQRDDGGFAGREGASDLYYTGFALRGLGDDRRTARPARRTGRGVSRRRKLAGDGADRRFSVARLRRRCCWKCRPASTSSPASHAAVARAGVGGARAVSSPRRRLREDRRRAIVEHVPHVPGRDLQPVDRPADRRAASGSSSS